MTNEPMTDPIIEFLESLKADIIHSLQSHGKIVTGQTAQQIIVTGDSNSAQLQLPGYMQLLETGRAPTGSNPTLSNPPMIERIKAWCGAKGIPDQAVWAIKKSIDKKGFKGLPGILSEPLSDENINFRLHSSAEQIANAVVRQIVNTLGPGN